MKRRVVIIPLTLLFLLLMTIPAFGQAQLDFNGKSLDSSGGIVLQDGVSFSSASAIANVLGCDVVIEGETVTMQENDEVLILEVGSKVASLNGVEKQIPGAPLLIDKQIYVPIRFVCESFGAIVSWNDLEKKVLVNYDEKRNGMNAEDLMVKTSEKMLEANTYKMIMDMDMDIDISGQENGGPVENIQVKTQSEVECWVQYDPLLMYMVQNVKMSGNEEIPADTIRTEMLIKDNAMYMSMPDIGWVKMDIPGLDMQELMSQSMSLDPAASLKMWSEMGILASLANNSEKNGQEYWIVKYNMGKEMMESDYFQQIIQSMSSLGTAGMDMQSLFDSIDFDLNSATWINPETLQTDYMDINGTIKIDMDMSSQGIPGHMAMNMVMDGSYSISDYGIEFETPDVSSAVDYNTLLTQQ
ncbi:hypothetical protein ASZ90_018946 [hydrocarbon metagenome]|uniref:Copper amine oxidase-like N-terminal domain-containing protein n=1 Tax=hydrocarbon metagenome TaxID=938273 RepID=A0A0W8E4U0_9ZZZZ